MYQSEFESYAVKHRGISSMTLHRFTSEVNRSVYAMTPNIIEERQLNVIGMDVFSRLMMDRIIFMGTGIDSYVANIIVAQLLFLNSTDRKSDISIYVIRLADRFMTDLPSTIRCNTLIQT